MEPLKRTPLDVAKEERDSWGEAYDRVQGYLLGLGVQDSLHRTRVAVSIIDTARGLHAKGGDPLAPVTLAMQCLRQRMYEWFVGQLDAADDARDRVQSVGRVALYLSDTNEKWPDSFLSHETPESVRQALESNPIRSGPALMFSSMISQEMDYGPIEKLVDSTEPGFGWGPVIRAFAIWGLVFALLIITQSKWKPAVGEWLNWLGYW